MTERLYLHDAYTSSFVARIVERVLLTDGRLAVVLDRTAFCPGVSGLLGDRGAVNCAQVMKVTVREAFLDLDHNGVPTAHIEQAEAAVNQVVLGNRAVRVAAQVLNAQGGGQPSLAQSAPVHADEARVEAAIAQAIKVLRA